MVVTVDLVLDGPQQDCDRNAMDDDVHACASMQPDSLFLESAVFHFI